MTRSRYYDRRGQPITSDEWVMAFKDNSLLRTTLPGGTEISTVYLGLDHRFGEGSPLIFETMVFGAVMDGEQERYSTEEEARAGHEAMVRRVHAAFREES